MYPEMKWVVTITDEILNENMMKVLPNWEISWVRIWWIDVNEELLAMFWHTIEYVQEELTHSQEIKIYLETSDSLATFLRNYTNLEEVSPKVFLVSEEYELFWEVYPAKYIDLN